MSSNQYFALSRQGPALRRDLFRRATRNSPVTRDNEAAGEVTGLVKALHDIDLRLEQLSAREVDEISDRQGDSVLLRKAQVQIRHRDEARQAAILDALPACILLLDAHGVIVSVNDAWRTLAAENSVTASDFGLGANYLSICDGATVLVH